MFIFQDEYESLCQKIEGVGHHSVPLDISEDNATFAHKQTNDHPTVIKVRSNLIGIYSRMLISKSHIFTVIDFTYTDDMGEQTKAFKWIATFGLCCPREASESPTSLQSWCHECFGTDLLFAKHQLLSH